MQWLQTGKSNAPHEYEAEPGEQPEYDLDNELYEGQAWAWVSSYACPYVRYQVIKMKERCSTIHHIQLV